MHPKLKICGMAQAANIAAIADLAPDYMGFIFYPKSPRAITEVSAELIKYVPATIQTTGVFVDEELDLVRSIVVRYNLKAVQLHGNEDVTYCAAIKEAGKIVIKAFGIGPGFDFQQLVPYVDVVDYFLFDTQTEARGGSGKRFDWQLLGGYGLDKPYFLSGGIANEHVDAIKSINDPRLYAIDINSRFEREPGLKDVEKIKTFINDMAMHMS